MKEIFENLIIFITRFDVYKRRMLSFDLIENLSIWQHYINDVLWSFLINFWPIYLNDILIYNKNHKKHSTHVKKVLKKVRVVDFQIDINKCAFFVIKIKYLKLIISIKRIKINSAKIKLIMKKNTSINFKHVKLFIDFCDFYPRFIKSFSKLSNFWTLLSRKISYSFETMLAMSFFENSKTEC